MKELYKIICDLYTEFYRQISLNTNFTYTPESSGSKKDQLIISRFLRWIKKNYKDQVDIVFLIDYFKFQFSHYAGVRTAYGRNAIMLHWIIGEKAIKRWESRDVRKKWIVKVKLRNEVELHLTDTYKKLLKKRNNDSNKYIRTYDYEEKHKLRFFNTDSGFQYCLYQTTLYNPTSKLCLKCNYKEQCNKILMKNHPKLYNLRNE